MEARAPSRLFVWDDVYLDFFLFFFVSFPKVVGGGILIRIVSFAFYVLRFNEYRVQRDLE